MGLPSSQEQLDRERNGCATRLERRSGPKAQSDQNLSTCRQILLLMTRVKRTVLPKLYASLK
jgi:hypothetical protein